MARFPIYRTSESTPSGGGAAPLSVNTDTGYGQVGAGVRRVGGEVFDAASAEYRKQGEAELIGALSDAKQTVTKMMFDLDRVQDETKYNDIWNKTFSSIKDPSLNNGWARQQYKRSIANIKSVVDEDIVNRQRKKIDEKHQYAVAKLMDDAKTTGNVPLLKSQLSGMVQRGTMSQEEMDYHVATVLPAAERTLKAQGKAEFENAIEQEYMANGNDLSKAVSKYSAIGAENKFGLSRDEASSVLQDFEAKITSDKQAKKESDAVERDKELAAINSDINSNYYKFALTKINAAKFLTEDDKQTKRLELSKLVDSAQKSKVTAGIVEDKKKFYEALYNKDPIEAIKSIKASENIDPDEIYQKVTLVTDGIEAKEKAAKLEKKALAEQTDEDKEIIAVANVYDEIEKHNWATAKIILNAIPASKTFDGKKKYDLGVMIDEQRQLTTGESAYTPGTYSELKSQALQLQDKNQFDAFLSTVALNENNHTISKEEAESLRTLSPGNLDSNIKAHVSEISAKTNSILNASTADFQKWFVIQTTANPRIKATDLIAQYTKLDKLHKWASSEAQREQANEVVKHKDDWDRQTREAELLAIRNRWLRLSDDELERRYEQELIRQGEANGG